MVKLREYYIVKYVMKPIEVGKGGGAK